MKWGILALLAGCAAPVPPAVPSDLQVCPDPAAAPDALPRVRTVEAVGRYAVGTDAALHRTEAALAECAHRLDRLNDLIRRR